MFPFGKAIYDAVVGKIVRTEEDWRALNMPGRWDFTPTEHGVMVKCLDCGPVGAEGFWAGREGLGEATIDEMRDHHRNLHEHRCPRCLHWWVSHGVPGEDGYGCSIPASSMAEREQGIFEVCGCVFAEGNPVTPEWVRMRP